MHRWFSREVILVTALFILSACAQQPPIQTLNDINEFSDNVRAATELFSAHIENVEKAHFAALKENTVLQFDLGGNPSLETEPLFSYEATSHRQKLLKILSVYAQNLKSVYPAGQAPSGDVVGQVQQIQSNIVDLSHGINTGDQAALIQSLNGTAAYIYATYRESRIGDIIRKAHPLVERAALLLYLDIGSPENEAPMCSAATSSHYMNLKIGDFRLCKGGLRSLLKHAIAARVTTLRQRLQLLREDRSGDRQLTVSRLYDTQSSGRILDQAMQETQEALFKLVAAHRDLRQRYGGEGAEGKDILPAWLGESGEKNTLSDVTDLLNKLPVLTEKGAALLDG